MFDQFLNYIAHVAVEAPNQAIPGVVGAVLGSYGAWNVAKLTNDHTSRKLRANIEQKDIRIEGYTEELERLKEQNLSSEQKFEELQTQHQLSETRLKRAKRRCKMYRRAHTALDLQLKSLTESDGHIWEREIRQPEKFVPIGERRPVIISVLNLKGGVGKTTLTANLGQTLASQGVRTLLIDLDHQRSLSELCLPHGEWAKLKKAGMIIDHAFLKPEMGATDFETLIAPLTDSNLSLIACDENLETVESKAMIQWLANPKGVDIRFQLRRLLHTSPVLGSHDWVFLDCPPRLNTATINALAASDYVLIPVIPNPTSSDALPRLLKWLRRLKYQAGLCPYLNVLGVVANMTTQMAKLTPTERNVWDNLPIDCKSTWKDPLHFFERHIPHKVDFSRAAQNHEFAVDQPAIKALFLELIQEIKTGTSLHVGT